MSLPKGDAERICRLALLKPERVEIANALVDGYTICGWSFEADELTHKGDGIAMVRAIERMAHINWRLLRKGYSKAGG